MKKPVFLIVILFLLSACGRTEILEEEEAPAANESGTVSQESGTTPGSTVAAIELKVLPLGSSNGPSLIQLAVDVTFTDQSRKEGVTYRALDPVSKKIHQVVWESTMGEIASVNDKGLLSPAAVGETLVKASLGEKTATAYILIQNQQSGSETADEAKFDIDVELNVAPEEYEELSTDAEADPPDFSKIESCDLLTVDRDPFADRVVEYNKGVGGGFHEELLPDIVLGPPHAHPESPLNGSFDVVSLGREGEITLEFADYQICDGEGDDFIVFENPWQYNLDAKYGTYAEPAIVSVSEDGSHYVEFPCDLNHQHFRGCAGVRAVSANPDLNDIDPTDPETAGGDSFDLKEVGLSSARFVRIRDGGQTRGPAGNGMRGFDLDAVAVVNGRLP